MAEITLEPTPLSKVIPISLKINDTDANVVTRLATKKQFNTSDTDAWLSFALEGLESTNGEYDLTMVNVDEKPIGSIVHKTSLPFSAIPFYYKMDSGADLLTNEIRHAGRWIGQIVVRLANGDTTSRQFDFAISGHLLDGNEARLILIEDYNSLIATINTSKDLLTQYNVDYAALLVDLAAAETTRTATYNQLLADQQANIEAFDVALDDGIVAANLATKLQDFETTNDSRLLSAEQQLAETMKYGVSATNPPGGLLPIMADGVTDDSDNLQALINYCLTNLKPLILPHGVISITKPLIVNNSRLNMIGQGFTSTTIKMVSELPVDAMLKTEGLPNTEYAYHNIVGITFEGNNKADYGIHFKFAIHSVVHYCSFERFNKSAIGFSGYCNNFENNIIKNCADGIVILDHDTYFVNNAINILSNKIYSNTGVGIKGGNGKKWNIYGNTIEQNEMGAIWLKGAMNGSIKSNYFEINGTTQITWRSSADYTMGAHIVLSAIDWETKTGLKGSASNEIVIAENTFWVENETHAVFASNVDTLDIKNNTAFYNHTEGTLNILAVEGNKSYSSNKNIKVRDNYNFDENIQIINITADFYHESPSLISSEKTTKINYFDDNFLEYLETGGSGTIYKSQENFYNIPVFEITGGKYYGKIIDLNEHPELRGKYIYVGAYVKVSDPVTQSPNILVDGSAWNTYNQVGVEFGTNWKFVCFYKKVDEIATQIDAKFGYKGTGAIKISCPTLTVIGATPFEFYDKNKRDVYYKSSSIPTLGYWNIGDIIYNKTPIAGGYTGWICTTTGTPGTWKGFGAIEA